MGKSLDFESRKTRNNLRKRKPDSENNRENNESINSRPTDACTQNQTKSARVVSGRSKNTRSRVSQLKPVENVDCGNQVLKNEDHIADKKKTVLEDGESCGEKFSSEIPLEVLPEMDLDFINRKTMAKVPAVNWTLKGSLNVTHHLVNNTLGLNTSAYFKKRVTGPVREIVSDLQLYRYASPFDRRVTAMEWHPSLPHVIAAGSKGGDIILWNIESTNQDLFMHGVGPGGSIQAMKFWPGNSKLLLTASIDGTIVRHDLEGSKSTIISDTMNCSDNWYCSVDVNCHQEAVLAGDNTGHTLLLSHQGQKLWSHRLHKSKVTHVEWSPREEWMFCTASCDQFVKLWDMRMIKGRESSLVALKHDKPINSAYFSLTDGCRLLTTDQKNNIRVYCAPWWSLETTVQHPHRFFQHITPFKAQWHPLVDMFVVGRYPDEKFQPNDSRTVDIFDGESGALICQLQNPRAFGLVSLNRFNHSGDSLASGMGCNILVWSRKEVLLMKQENLLAELKKGMYSQSRLAGTNNSGGQAQRKPRSQQKKQTNTKTSETKQTKTKLKTKLNKK